MNDVERWIRDEGPPPPAVEELLAAMAQPPQRTPEEVAASKRSILAALAEQDRRLDEEDRRREERARRVRRWVLGVGALAAVVTLVVASLLFGPALMARIGVPAVDPAQIPGALGRTLTRPVRLPDRITTSFPTSGR